jgi:hypothetical protein
MNRFTRKNALAVALDEEIRAAAPGSTRGLFILSQWVAEYRDLAELGGCLQEQAPAVAVAGGGDLPPVRRAREQQGWDGGARVFLSSFLAYLPLRCVDLLLLWPAT